MREFREIRRGLGDNADAAAPYLGVARTQLGILKSRMAHGGLAQLTRTVQLEDGTSITVSSRMGQDSVRITAASTNQPAAPATVEFHEERVGEPDDALITDFPPDVAITFQPGDEEVYSATYLSAILLGAVMDKTAKNVFLAYASPNMEQGLCLYDTISIANNSQLVKLDHKLKEVGRFGCAQPDWGGQLTYDIVTDSFYMNAWTVADSRFISSIGVVNNFFRIPWPLPHRSLIKIGMAGDQTEMPDGIINVFPEVWPAYTWGNTTWAFGITVYGWPAGGGLGTYTVPFSVNRPNKEGTQQQSQTIPMSQPSTSGLIAALFPGVADVSAVGPGWEDRSSWAGYAFLWSTVTQQVVWRGQGLGSAGPIFVDSSSDFDRSKIFDPWATITPAGNAIFSIAGKLTPVQIGSAALIPAPPAGCVGIAVTNGDKQAYAISPTGAYHYHAGKWAAIHLGGTGAPHSVLHDLVTDAVAIVMNDASGAWIFNGHDGLNRPLAPFKVVFTRPPNRDPRMFYPQQFINGALLITYALPWDGTRGSTGTAYITNEFLVVTGNVTFGLPVQPGQPRGMGAHYIVGEQPPTPWRAELGRVGPRYETFVLAHGGGLVKELIQTNPDSAFDGSIDPFRWVIGRYDIGQLTATST